MEHNAVKYETEKKRRPVNATRDTWQIIVIQVLQFNIQPTHSTDAFPLLIKRTERIVKENGKY